MKKIKCVAIIIAIALTTILSVYAAETHTEWTSEPYNGSASAYACSTYSEASASSQSESPFARAVFENASGRISNSDEQPAGGSVSVSAYASELPNPSATFKTSFAWAFIGDLEVVCSQYY